MLRERSYQRRRVVLGLITLANAGSVQQLMLTSLGERGLTFTNFARGKC